MQTVSKLPTPQNISKWSKGRKEIIAQNKSLKIQLDSKDSIIRNLESEIVELNIKLKLNGLEFPSQLSDSKEIYFEYELMSDDGKYLTYSVKNYDLEYDNEVQIPISEILEHFEYDDITERDLESYIREYISECLSF